jgi:hypothetical protein
VVVWLVIFSVLVQGEVPELLSGEGVLLGVVSVPCHGEVMNHSCPSLIPRWLQGDCRENGSEQRQIQNGGRDAMLFSCY